MNKFSINIFASLIQRLPFVEVQKLLEKYKKDLDKISIVDSNQIFKFLDSKFKTIQTWYNEDAKVDVLTFKSIATKVPELTLYTFEEISNLNKLHPTLQVEVANLLTEDEKLNLLSNFKEKLSPLVSQSLILSLNEENKKK